ncbi:Protein FAR-RED ELONGATED HYPOCOTYL 3 [Bienertia sinuspersici]
MDTREGRPYDGLVFLNMDYTKIVMPTFCGSYNSGAFVGYVEIAEAATQPATNERGISTLAMKTGASGSLAGAQQTEETQLDVAFSLSIDNVVIPSNNDVPGTVTEGLEKGHATLEVGMTFESFEVVDEFYTALGPIESPVGPLRRRKKSKKCGYGVGIATFLNKDGLWKIHKVELTNENHAPSPSKSRYVLTFHDVPKFIIRIVKDLIDAGVKQSQIFHALANQLNGFENIPFLLKDMHNVVQKDRCKEFDEQDCHAMFQYFTKMKEAYEDFFYSWTVDEAKKLKDVVWIDARSWAAYLDYGDVVCFVATYITNHYELPFANFVGVNQQGQSILLGCTLIRHEDSETYKWVMRQWLECMCDVQPGGIITDQSTPMANLNMGEFQKNMKEVVYDFLTPEEFEESLSQGRLLGISTTQRVERIHHFYKGFMNVKATLRNFVQNYTRALDHRANAEKVATANDDRRETHLLQHVTKYTIEDKIQVWDPVHHVSKELKVVLGREMGELRCTCRLFEHRGILCRHCIRVMEMTNMPSVPQKHGLYGVLQYEYDKVFQHAASSSALCDHTILKAHELLNKLDELCRASTSRIKETMAFPAHKPPFTLPQTAT